jgi:hypothetical protein
MWLTYDEMKDERLCKQTTTRVKYLLEIY